jgi:hypothetical protein
MRESVSKKTGTRYLTERWSECASLVLRSAKTSMRAIMTNFQISIEVHKVREVRRRASRELKACFWWVSRAARRVPT